MAYALRFDSAQSQWVELPPYTFPSSGTIEVRKNLVINTENTGSLFLFNATVRVFIEIGLNGTLRLQVRGLTNTLNSTTPNNTFIEGEIINTAFVFNLDNGDYSLFVNSVEVVSGNIPDYADFHDKTTFANQNTSLGNYLNLDYSDKLLYLFQILENGTVVRNYDPSASNGSGLQLLDTVGGFHGDLQNYGDAQTNDDSQWEFFTAGATDFSRTLNTTNEYGALVTNTFLPDGAGNTLFDATTQSSLTLTNQSATLGSIIDNGDETVSYSGNSDVANSTLLANGNINLAYPLLNQTITNKDLVMFFKIDRGSNQGGNAYHIFKLTDGSSSLGLCFVSAAYANTNNGIRIICSIQGMTNTDDLLPQSDTYEVLLYLSGKTGDFRLYVNGVLLQVADGASVAGLDGHTAFFGIGGDEDKFHGMYWILTDTPLTTSDAHQLALNPYQVFGTGVTPSLNIIDAEQDALANVIQLSQSQQIDTLSASQQSLSDVIDITQKSNQALSIIDSEQDTLANVISITQQGAQALSIIDAEQQSLADAIDITQRGVQVLSAVSAEQVNQCSVVNISEKMNLLLANANQITITQQISVSQGETPLALNAILIQGDIGYKLII